MKEVEISGTCEEKSTAGIIGSVVDGYRLILICNHQLDRNSQADPRDFNISHASQHVAVESIAIDSPMNHSTGWASITLLLDTPIVPGEHIALHYNKGISPIRSAIDGRSLGDFRVELQAMNTAVALDEKSDKQGDTQAQRKQTEQVTAQETPAPEKDEPGRIVEASINHISERKIAISFAEDMAIDDHLFVSDFAANCDNQGIALLSAHWSLSEVGQAATLILLSSAPIKATTTSTINLYYLAVKASLRDASDQALTAFHISGKYSELATRARLKVVETSPAPQDKSATPTNESANKPAIDKPASLHAVDEFSRLVDELADAVDVLDFVTEEAASPAFTSTSTIGKFAKQLGSQIDLPAENHVRDSAKQERKDKPNTPLETPNAAVETVEAEPAPETSDTLSVAAGTPAQRSPEKNIETTKTLTSVVPVNLTTVRVVQEERPAPARKIQKPSIVEESVVEEKVQQKSPAPQEAPKESGVQSKPETSACAHNELTIDKQKPLSTETNIRIPAGKAGGRRRRFTEPVGNPMPVAEPGYDQELYRKEMIRNMCTDALGCVALILPLALYI